MHYDIFSLGTARERYSTHVAQQKKNGRRKQINKEIEEAKTAMKSAMLIHCNRKYFCDSNSAQSVIGFSWAGCTFSDKNTLACTTDTLGSTRSSCIEVGRQTCAAKEPAQPFQVRQFASKQQLRQCNEAQIISSLLMLILEPKNRTILFAYIY